MTENSFEIQQAMSDCAEQHVKQANAAYKQLADFVNKSITTGAMPSVGLKDFQDRAMDFALENAEISLHVRRQSRQRKDHSGDFDASGTVRSKPHAGLRQADAGR